MHDYMKVILSEKIKTSHYNHEILHTVSTCSSKYHLNKKGRMVVFFKKKQALLNKKCK